MKYIQILFFGNLFSLVSICTSAYLIANDKDGWGWFLAIGFFTVSSYSSEINQEKPKETLSDKVKERENLTK